MKYFLIKAISKEMIVKKVDATFLQIGPKSFQSFSGWCQVKQLVKDGQVREEGNNKSRLTEKQYSFLINTTLRNSIIEKQIEILHNE